MAVSVAQKRAKQIGKLLIVLGIVAFPILLLLRRADMIEIGGSQIFRLKTYDTLQTREEKMRRGEVWFKIGAYSNALDVYTDLLFAQNPAHIRRYEYGYLPIQNKEQPKTDLMFYRWCVCLSALNKRSEGMAACDQFETEFRDSPYMGEVEKLRKQLRERQL